MIDINFQQLRTIGLNQALASQLAQLTEPHPGARLVRITEVHRDVFTVHDGHTQFSARALPRLHEELAASDMALAVGDWVLADPDQRLTARLEPITFITRRGPDGRRQALASNVDTALLVMGLDHDFNPRRLERYIALARPAGVEPVVVLTKADAGNDVERRIESLRQRLPANVPIIALDARDSQTTQALAPWLNAGQTLIMLGSSGAGKSTLTNSLSRSEQDTGGVRSGDGRGRHTTTSRSLHQCDGGACLIDTPGLRSWSIDAGQEELSAAFDDINELATQCQFRDCRHEAEPGCAVRGVIDADRLRNYHKLIREAQRSEQTPLDRIAERSRWKVLLKGAADRARQKRR